MKRVISSLICLLMFSLPAYAAGNPQNGEQLFKKQCKACHRLTDSKLVGPGLGGVTKRRSEEWLHKWIQNPKAMLESGDPIAVELRKGFNKTMRTLEAMQDKNNRNDVIEFLKMNDKKSNL